MKIYVLIYVLALAPLHPIEASLIDFFSPKISTKKVVFDTSIATPETSRWKILKPGLLLVCSCSNTKCPSKKKKENVWVHLGIGHHNVPQYFIYEETPCRACKTTISIDDIRGIAFYNCEYTVKGAWITDKRNYDLSKDFRKKKEYTKALTISGTDVNDTKIHTYSIGEVVAWVFLTITASQ